jgi:beta-glucuronidase
MGGEMLRERVDLCGLWRAQPDPAGEGEGAGYAGVSYDERFWREVRLPGAFDDLHPDLGGYEGAVWFRRHVIAPASWQGKRVVLRCEGANYHATFWVNGALVGQHEDGFLPLALPVENRLRYGAENTIVARVDNERRAGEVPGLERGWRTFGGILREVELLATDPLYLDQVAIGAVPTVGGGRLRMAAALHNGRTSEEQVSVSVRVQGSESAPLVVLQAQPARIGPGETVEIQLESSVEGVEPWSLATPRLYPAVLEAHIGSHMVDRQTLRIGFRKIEARDGELLLNGEPVYLSGFNRHEDVPERGPAPDLDAVRRDLTEIRAAGANFVRLCHYPHHPGELALCDELGLLAMGEIPLYWWAGNEEGEAACQHKLAAAKRQLRTMIERDRNHPALVFWSVSNESREDRAEVAAGNRELVELAQTLDPTRLAVHVSNHWRGEGDFAADDVICVNGYPSFDAHRKAGVEAYDVSASTRFWRDGLAALHERYPGKPILVSEFGHPAFQGVRGNTYGEDTQAAAIVAEFAGMDAPYVCGATIWCWADHPWPATTFAYCNYLATSPYGVLTRDRHKLQAYQAIRQLFRQRQGQGEEWRPAGPQPDRAGYSLHMVRPNLDDIPHAPFPKGFGIRPMRLGEGAMWVDIERDAEPYYPIADDLFAREFGRDPQATQWRSFLVVNDKGVAVGTVSAWYNRDYHGQDHGVIHWIAIRPAYQGLGLGKAALAYALHQLNKWHERCYLITQSRRLPAIHMYLNFGFLPELAVPGAEVGWREVKAQLQHPTLEALDF